MPLARDTRLGPYEICSLIGAGGMGEVYKAHDARLDRFVAIKVLLARNLDDPDRKRRFTQEARAASALNHPGIVTVYDVGCDCGVDYIAMEFIEGKTLEELIPRNGLSLNEVLRYSTQAADAIAKAHSAGILHRDLKPGNVIVTTAQQVKVLDFGLAKVLPAPAGEGRDTTGSVPALTIEGTVMGTASYMSPEQAEGKMLDNRSDIFSFGAILYEMTTGQRAFQGDTVMSTIGCVLRDEPKAVREIRQETPAELERLIRRCLRKDPARRIQTMSDLKVALEELKEESDSGRLAAPVLAIKRRPTLLWVGLLVLCCTLVALATLLLRPSASSNSGTRPVPLTSYEGDERQPDFSPDGSQVAFTWNGPKQGNWGIYLKVVGSSAAPLRLTSDSFNDTKPKWSPDGKLIAFIRSKPDTDSIMLTSALGGSERPLASFPTAIDAGLSWSPDSKWLAVAVGDKGGPTALRLYSVETGESRPLTAPPAESGGDFDPSFSPDGRSIVYVRERGMNVEELWVLALHKNYEVDGQPKKVLGDGNKNHSPAWSADGRELIFSSGELALASMYRMPADGSTPPVRINSLGDGATEPALSRPAHRLAFSRTFRSSSIWRLDTESGNNQPEQFIASSSFRDAFPQYSPDGKKIAFFSNRTGLNQIWTCNADGSQPIQLTSMSGTTTGTPRWSPDGQWISFDSNSGGHWQIYVVAANGGKPRALTNGDLINVVASWSRDGKWIYFTSKRTGAQEVWKTPADQSGTAVQVTHQGGTSNLESPDGKTLYFTKNTGAYEFSLWKMPVGGGEETEVLTSLHRYNFTLTDKAIFYATTYHRDAPAEIRRLDLATGKTTTLYKLTKRIDLGLAVSPDSRYLLFAQLDYIGSDLMSVENFR